MKITISIIGSTGSIGLSSLKIINKKNKNFRINLLSANKNYRLILKQIKKYKPKYFIISDTSVFLKVKKNNYKNTKILNSFESLNLIKKNDITICAIPGIAGLEPTIRLTKFSKKLFIANKESVVIGWNIISKMAKKYNTKIVPLDSEHFAISRLLSKYKISDVKKIYITASGGPFLNYSTNDLKKIKPEDALKHPKWKMGKKISIDSSTLMNKILELVEAQKLFNIPKDKIDIVIHPNSLVHAFVELNNGLSEFIYHETSMIIPIANAIYDGNLKIEDFYKKKKLFQERKLIFQNVDQKIFPLIKLKNLINKYPSAAIIVNASNEILVEQFLKEKIPFLGISKIIMSVLRDRNYKKNAIIISNNLNQIIKLDKWAKQITFSKIDKFYG
tara:strand:+ start:1299 stop:2465 length:1167 start_codon:yes stop_codon:yes gene_type:complete